MVADQIAEPERPTASRGLPAILIDALNLAYWCGPPPSLRLPMAAMTALIARGQPAWLYFDASARHRLPDEAPLYDQLMQCDAPVLQVPAGRSADQWLLRQARATGACILSRDHYGDHRRRYRKLIDDPARLLKGWVREDRLLVPGLQLDVALPVSAAAAWSALQHQLNSDFSARGTRALSW